MEGPTEFGVVTAGNDFVQGSIDGLNHLICQISRLGLRVQLGVNRPHGVPPALPDSCQNLLGPCIHVPVIVHLRHVSLS